MSDKIRSITRRQALKGAAAGVAAAATVPMSFTRAFAAPKTIKIGLVQPTTGPLAFFTEHIPFVLEQVKKRGLVDKTIFGTDGPQYAGMVRSYVGSITASMKDEGFTDEDIAKVMARNFFAVFFGAS